MRQVQHFIDGSAFAGESKRRGDVFNPATGEVDAQVALASASDLDAAVRSATVTLRSMQ